jgi:ribosome biogenesis GTPase
MSLEKYGWGPFFSQQLESNSTFIPGRVSSQHGGLYRVLTDTGEVVANVSGRLRNFALSSSELPAVGDWVLLQRREQARAVIHRVLSRRTQLSRRAPGKRSEEQIMAANVDTVFIVTALDADFSVRRMERYLSLVYESGAIPVLVLNKCDVAEDAGGKRLSTESIARGSALHLVSAHSGEGVVELHRYLKPGRTVAFIGSSGVGKSTLINVLFGNDVQLTRAIRVKDSKGRHTTTYRRLIPMPGGAMLLDTPGMREVQLWAEDEALHSSFGDIAEAARDCRFRDCTHQHEPGCAVRESIDAERLSSYHRQQKELEFLHRQTDIYAAQAEKQRWKAIHKSMRNYQKGE